MLMQDKEACSDEEQCKQREGELVQEQGQAPYRQEAEETEQQRERQDTPIPGGVQVWLSVACLDSVASTARHCMAFCSLSVILRLLASVSLIG